jgi:hypothetical protein
MFVHMFLWKNNILCDVYKKYKKMCTTFCRVTTSKIVFFFTGKPHKFFYRILRSWPLDGELETAHMVPSVRSQASPFHRPFRTRLATDMRACFPWGPKVSDWLYVTTCVYRPGAKSSFRVLICHPSRDSYVRGGGRRARYRPAVGEASPPSVLTSNPILSHENYPLLPSSQHSFLWRRAEKSCRRWRWRWR